MEYRKTIIFLMVAIFIFSITAVSASDVNDTVINSDDASLMELSAGNEMDVDNLKTSEENTALSYVNNVESVGGIDSAVMGADTGTYSGLSNEIGYGGNIELKHNYYTYDTGITIKITVDNSVIDGKGAVIDMAGSNNIRTFTVSASGVTIKNLTIKNANPIYTGRGSAIYFMGLGILTNCNFTDNNGDFGGAVYFTTSGSVTNCYFTNNHAKVDGGAIYCNHHLDVKNCLFDSNQAKGSNAQCYGGAIRAVSILVDGSRFINNCVGDYGGAIYAEKVTLTSIPSYFIGNVAEDNQGGAIYTDTFTNDVVSNIVFINNQAKANDDGGAIYINKETHVTFDRCVFVDNYCGDEGGAIYLDSDSSTLSLSNNIFKNNHAGYDVTDAGHTVYNKGTYSTICNNWWGDVIPCTDNGVLIEWKATIFKSNIHHVDTDPLHIELRLSKNSAGVNEVVRATLCYVKSDGSILLNDPYGDVSFNLPENFTIKSRGISQYGKDIDFTSNKPGSFDITATLYGQSLTQKINFVLKEGEGSYSTLRNEIGNGGDIVLTKKYYYYFDGDGESITITTLGVIDGNGAVIDMARSTIRAFTVFASGVTIKNLTIKNANYDDSGGAIFFTQTGSVENCNFTKNTAIFGGAIRFGSNGTVLNCNFINNSATQSGGAISFNCTGTVLNCNFADNNAEYGGAVYFNDYSMGNMTNCNFTDNTASEDGGAVYIYSTGNVSNCNFANNSANLGGAVYIYSTGNVSNCNFTDNNAEWGAVYFNDFGNVINSNFTDNNAYEGGAVYFSGIGNVSNCNFVDNSATYYGGAIRFDGNGIVTNCNFINNTARVSGGAVYFDSNNSSEVTNCNFIGNYAKYKGGAIYSRLYNKVIVNTCIFKTHSDTTYQVIFRTSLFDSGLKISVGEVIEGSNATITITTNNTFNGDVTVTIGDENYTVVIVKGGGSCNVSGLKAGTYTATVMFNKTDNFNASSKTINFSVFRGGEGSYSNLRNEIGNGGDIVLTKKYYHYVNGDGEIIEITTPGVIDGRGAIIDMFGSTNMQAFHVSASGVTIKNLTIKNVNYNGEGGAIYFSGSGVVSNCNFTGNTAQYGGGAVYFSDIGNVSNCNFINNTAQYDGGAVYFSGRGDVSNCNFTGNTAQYDGGAVFFFDEGVVSNCIFDNNSASNGGAVLSSFYDKVIVDTCIFKTSSDTTYLTIDFPPSLVINKTVYSSGEKLIFNLKTNSNISVINGNISISVYLKNNTNWVGNYSCLSGEGWVIDLPVGSYYAIFNTEYKGFQPIKLNLTVQNKQNQTLFNPGLNINVGNVTEGSNATILITTNNAYNGEVTVTIGDKNYTVEIIDGVGSCNVSGLKAGNYNVTVILNPTSIFNASSKTINFIVGGKENQTLVDPGLNINVGDVIEGSNATINITTNNAYNGDVTVIIGEENYTVEIVDGVGSCSVSGLKAGIYNATVILNPTEAFQASNKTISFTVESKENQTLVDPGLNISIGDVIEGSNATIIINTNNTFNGNVTVKIGDKNYTAEIVNGVGSCSVSGLKAGNYNVTVILNPTSIFNASSKTISFTVKSKENQTLPVPELNINIDDVTEGSNATITITPNKTYNGEVTVIIGVENYTVEIINGTGTLPITGLKAGNYTAAVILNQTSNFKASSKTISFTVKNKLGTIIKSSAVTTTYATSKNIIITLTDTQGKALSGKKVSVVLNGVSKILTTNNKGQCILATGTTLIPKNYKVSFKFTGDDMYMFSSGSVDLVVKKSTPKITAKNKKYKAKTKNKKYTITLKNDKKQAIKNTKLTLKVNGKTYTAKTNNKGQATFKIKKLTKKGKYKITITFKTNNYYNKLTTKTTITII